MNNDVIPSFDDNTNDQVSIKLVPVPSLPECIRISVTGLVDTYNSTFFGNQVHKVLKSHYRKLWLDLAGVNYMSSTGVGAMNGLLKASREDNKMLLVSSIQPKVYEVFQLLGFSQFFDIVDDHDQALAKLSAQEGATLGPFPATFQCPICSKRLRSSAQGKFRCPECRTILAVDKHAKVKLG